MLKTLIVKCAGPGFGKREVIIIPGHGDYYSSSDLI
jgi:hypothetical protein